MIDLFKEHKISWMDWSACVRVCACVCYMGGSGCQLSKHKLLTAEFPDLLPGLWGGAGSPPADLGKLWLCFHSPEAPTLAQFRTSNGSELPGIRDSEPVCSVTAGLVSSASWH